MKIGTLPATNWVCSIWQTESQTWSDHPRHGIPYSPPATVMAQSWPGTVAMHVISVGLEEASPFFVSRAAEECHQSLDDAEVLSLAAAALQKHLAGERPPASEEGRAPAHAGARPDAAGGSAAAADAALRRRAQVCGPCQEEAPAPEDLGRQSAAGRQHRQRGRITAGGGHGVSHVIC